MITLQEVTFHFDNLTLVVDVPGDKVVFIMRGGGRKSVELSIDQLMDMIKQQLERLKENKP